MENSIRILVIDNGLKWESMPRKLSDVADFYKSVVTLEIERRDSSFFPVPFASVDAIDGFSNVELAANTVDPDWYEANVSPLAAGFDIVVFCLSAADLKRQTRLPAGISSVAAGKLQKVCMFVTDEAERSYLTKDGIFSDIGNTFSYFLMHEVSHCLYAMLGKPDMTHRHFYGGHPELAVSDFEGFLHDAQVLQDERILNLQSQEIGLLNRLIALLRKKLGLG